MLTITIDQLMILLIILSIFLLIGCYLLLGINEKIQRENEELKNKLDIIHNELDGILERYSQAGRQPPPKS